MSNSDMACKSNCGHESCIKKRQGEARIKSLKNAKCGDPLSWIKSVCCEAGVKKWLVGFECTKCKRKDVKAII